MAVYKNNTAGARVLNVTGGAPGQVLQVTIAPGGLSGEVELAPGEENSPVVKAMFDKKELEEAGQDALKGPAPFDPTAEIEAQQKAQDAIAEAQRLAIDRQAAELDLNRLTPPRQLGGDGGPGQGPTVDNRGGALTPSQEEHGRVEPPNQGAVVTQVRAGNEKPEEQEKQAKSAHKADPKKG